MLFAHWSDIPPSLWPWQNFYPDEPFMACPCCGEAYVDVAAMNMIQKVRDLTGLAVWLNSGHRCRVHNARVGGAPGSRHLKLAFDIRLANHDRFELLEACRTAGFTGFGYYQTFLHADPGRPRYWYGSSKARQLWT